MFFFTINLKITLNFKNIQIRNKIIKILILFSKKVCNKTYLKLGAFINQVNCYEFPKLLNFILLFTRTRISSTSLEQVVSNSSQIYLVKFFFDFFQKKKVFTC